MKANATLTWARLTRWLGQLPCRLGSHDWYVLESRIDNDIETVKAACSKCPVEETFTTHLKQPYYESLNSRL